MAKPILGNPVLTGDEARSFREYVDNAEVSPSKRKEFEEGMKTFKPVSKRTVPNTGQDSYRS